MNDSTYMTIEISRSITIADLVKAAASIRCVVVGSHGGVIRIEKLPKRDRSKIGARTTTGAC